ncbi:MAG: hypothetical protein EZS28_009018 [Streblomastix strix]|uniref:Uncharacterized protein n=1 Tax=Streblomastix strix TaxID=222440 RepID=A0A5J4WKC2_9EUKA|nr:MAG: hypothetical protein EZS28_009018 [Streblomastix strix]
MHDEQKISDFKKKLLQIEIRNARIDALMQEMDEDFAAIMNGTQVRRVSHKAYSQNIQISVSKSDDIMKRASFLRRRRREMSQEAVNRAFGVKAQETEQERDQRQQNLLKFVRDSLVNVKQTEKYFREIREEVLPSELWKRTLRRHIRLSGALTEAQQTFLGGDGFNEKGEWKNNVWKVTASVMKWKKKAATQIDNRLKQDQQKGPKYFISRPDKYIGQKCF